MSKPSSTAPSSQLPYWQYNVPPDQRTEECPRFLQNLSEPTRTCLMVQDEDFHQLSWDDIQEIVANNDLVRLTRVPSELRRYMAWKWKTKAKYGSITAYVLKERLQWTPTALSGDPPFSNPAEYKITWNHWPYGVVKGIVHLVVWTKFPLPKLSDAGDIMPSTKVLLEDFVVKHICQAGRIDRSRVAWFKNWALLQSLPGIEHFHVMLYKPDKAFVEEITEGDEVDTSDV